MTTSGEVLPRRAEIWWVRVEKRRPAVVVQTDRVREPRVRSFLVVPLTSRLHLAGLPGNVRLDRRETRLPKPSVANIYDVQKVLRADFVERLGVLPDARLAAVADGLVHTVVMRGRPARASGAAGKSSAGARSRRPRRLLHHDRHTGPTCRSRCVRPCVRWWNLESPEAAGARVVC